MQDLAREHDLADVGDPDAEHDAGRGAEQGPDLGARRELAHARARVREQRRWSGGDSAARAADGDRGDQHGGDGEGDGVDAHQRLGRDDGEADRGQRGAGGQAEVVDRAVQAHGGGLACRRRPPAAGSPASAAGVNSAVPMPATSAPTIITGSEPAVMTTTNARQRSTSATTAHVRQPIAVDERAEQRPEHDRRQQIGHQHGGDRPRRVEAVVGEQRQRDVRRGPCPRQDCACAAKKRRAGAPESALRNIRRPAGRGLPSAAGRGASRRRRARARRRRSAGSRRRC